MLKAICRAARVRDLDHHLHAGIARAVHELTQCAAGELGGIGRVVQAAGAQAVAERVGGCRIRA
jgi:hypothetical protein